MKEKDFVDKIFCCDVVQGLKELPDNSVDCCVTSPPYYNVRDYGVDGQIGLEQTPAEYVERITQVFSEVFRVLKPTGTLWLNIGDTYNGTKLGNTNAKFKQVNSKDFNKKQWCGAKNKDLLGIPWMVAFALRDKVGFYLRNDIIWEKPNCMPESVTDRCTRAHEYIFLMSKSQKYYFDYESISEPCSDQKRTNFQSGSRSNGKNKDRNDNDLGERIKTWQPRTKTCNMTVNHRIPMHINRELGIPDKEYTVRNKRTVWHVNSCPDPCAHFAVYPEKLIEPCILAGCPKDGVVLDPFMGSGTTAKVAQRFDRHYVGFEINPEYVEIAKKKLSAVQKELFV